MSSRRPLSRLPTSILPSIIQDQLSTLGILTVGDLYSASSLQIISYTDLTIEDYRRVLSDIATKIAHPTVTALSLLHSRSQSLSNNQTQGYPPYLSTGLTPLDEVLRGGLPVGTVTDICGLPGAGKTQFALYLTISTLLDNPNASVVYIDAELKLDSNRLVQLFTAQYQKRHPQRPLTPEILDAFLQRILIKRPSTVEDFHAVLLGLEEEVISSLVPLIIVDSIAGLIKRHNIPTQELDRFLISTVYTLRKVASLCHCAIFATNQVVATANNLDTLVYGGDVLTSAPQYSATTALDPTRASTHFSMIPALGVTWYHCLSTRIYITKLPISDLHHLALYDSHYATHPAVSSFDQYNDPETSFVFNDASCDDLDVSLVPGQTRVSTTTSDSIASTAVPQTIGKLSIIKSLVTGQASVVYVIDHQGIQIIS